MDQAAEASFALRMVDGSTVAWPGDLWIGRKLPIGRFIDRTDTANGSIGVCARARSMRGNEPERCAATSRKSSPATSGSRAPSAVARREPAKLAAGPSATDPDTSRWVVEDGRLAMIDTCPEEGITGPG